ncbi:MAG: cytochrome c oxidase subunit II [candidate division NC10 bacterium]|nr:cytochrome c oxidase subunit II [candidate division NC10 bacterium]
MMRWLPENVSSFGGDIDAILSLIYSATLAWFFLTLGAILLFLFLYRRREGRGATYIRGDKLSEAVWILIPAVIVLVLDLWIDFRGADAWAKVKGRVPSSDLRVEVTGKQFNWEIRYPGPDGKLGTADDLQLDNELHVPVNQVVRVTLKSKDVIHSFFLPNLRLKQDILPGREVEAWFQATKPGRYEMPCSELCGFGHSGMKGWLHVHPADEYQQWVRERWPSSRQGEGSKGS